MKRRSVTMSKQLNVTDFKIGDRIYEQIERTEI